MQNGPRRTPGNIEVPENRQVAADSSVNEKYEYNINTNTTRYYNRKSVIHIYYLTEHKKDIQTTIYDNRYYFWAMGLKESMLLDLS